MIYSITIKFSPGEKVYYFKQGELVSNEIAAINKIDHPNSAAQQVTYTLVDGTVKSEKNLFTSLNEIQKLINECIY